MKAGARVAGRANDLALAALADDASFARVAVFIGVTYFTVATVFIVFIARCASARGVFDRADRAGFDAVSRA